MTEAEILWAVLQINRELEINPVITPSRFWREYGIKHTGLLVKHGIENFKRTVAHNYYNWLYMELHNRSILRLIELWMEHESLEMFTDRMEIPDAVGLPLKGWGDNALLNNRVRRIYQMGVSLLWDYTLRTDKNKILSSVYEPLLGNPLRIWRGDTLLSQDLAHSVRERNLIVGASDDKNLVIGELGAGAGRLAYMFNETTDCRYLIFDIAPALVVSQWYIRNLYPEEKIFTFRHFDRFEEVAEEVSQARFAFFTANQLSMIPDDYFNVFINVCSLMEMRVDSIEHYMREIDRTTAGVFYTKQWVEQVNNPDGLVLREKDYPIAAQWSSSLNQRDAIDSTLFEQIWRTRRASAGRVDQVH